VDPGEAERRAEDGVWRASIGRLASQVSGPEDVVAGSVRFSTEDVEVLFENRNRATLSVTAVQLEYVLSHRDSLVGLGTSQRIRDYIGLIKEETLSEDDALCLQRIEVSLQRLPGVERADVTSEP
jgi:hypothetical protein